MKNKGEKLLLEIIQLRLRLFERLSFCFPMGMVHSCQMGRFNFPCLLIIIVAVIYFASVKFSQRTQKHEGFLLLT